MHSSRSSLQVRYFRDNTERHLGESKSIKREKTNHKGKATTETTFLLSYQGLAQIVSLLLMVKRLIETKMYNSIQSIQRKENYFRHGRELLSTSPKSTYSLKDPKCFEIVIVSPFIMQVILIVIHFTEYKVLLKL